jgi:hypothetical protein
MQTSRRIAAVFAVALMSACCGCTISRLYGGAQLRGDPAQIVQGTSTRGDVLKLFGPPDTIEHQTSGDAFVYRYRQVNSASITIREPVFVRQTIFQFSRTFDNSDVLIVLFDFNGLVSGVALKRDTEEMPAL